MGYNESSSSRIPGAFQKLHHFARVIIRSDLLAPSPFQHRNMPEIFDFELSSAPILFRKGTSSWVSFCWYSPRSWMIHGLRYLENRNQNLAYSWRSTRCLTSLLVWDQFTWFKRLRNSPTSAVGCQILSSHQKERNWASPKKSVHFLGLGSLTVQLIFKVNPRCLSQGLTYLRGRQWKLQHVSHETSAAVGCVDYHPTWGYQSWWLIYYLAWPKSIESQSFLSKAATIALSL